MITNQKFHLFRLPLFIFILLLANSVDGQNLISDVLRDGKPITTSPIIIKITPPKGKSRDVEIFKKKEIKSGTILEVPGNITIIITSINKNIGAITGPCIVEFTASKKTEEYRVIDGEETCVVMITTNTELVGNVLLSGPTKMVQALSELTQFSLKVDGKNIEFELIEGKIDIKERVKVEVKDENIIDSLNKRTLFASRNKQLREKGKDSIKNYKIDSFKTETYENKDEINRFFNQQYKLHKKMYLKSGMNSKLAYKNFNNGTILKGLDYLEKALDSGEISLDFIIQSALIIADNYYNKSDFEKSKIWLEAGLQFSSRYYDRYEALYSYFEDDKNKITKAFGNDLMVANEYYAWAYTLKLRVYGCLENADEMPSIYRRRAKELKDKIENY
jgi:hypothetical protein